MHPSKRLVKRMAAALPALLICGSLGGAGALVALLANPDAMMRAALSGSEPTIARSTPISPVDGERRNFRAVSNDPAAAPPFRLPLQKEPDDAVFAIGDRVTLNRGDGARHTWEVIEIRRLDRTVTKVADGGGGSSWALVTLRDVEAPDAAKVRLLIQEGTSAPFSLKKIRDHSL